MGLIDLHRVVKKYGGHVVLNGLSLSLEKGEILLVEGPSGAGKSTFVRLVSFIEPPTSGRVEFDGVDPWRDPRRLLRSVYLRIAVGFQEPVFLPHISLRKNIWVAAAPCSQGPDEGMVSEYAEELDIEGVLDKRPSQVSVGQLKRYESLKTVVRARLCSVDAVIVDEPTSNLDPENACKVVSLLKRTARELGLLLVMTTTDPRTADILEPDVVLRLPDGEITRR